jgi:predicted ATPase/DNA-binding CsgD family transcriptional regulator
MHRTAADNGHQQEQHVYHNLPHQPMPMVGRGREVEAVCSMLRRADVRLLTLFGPPGIGKTRLSIQAASELLDDFPGGVCFVPLAAITDPDLVVPAAAQALRVKETQGETLTESLQRFLGNRRLLLVLDNFEQIIRAAPAVAQLLETCPHLKVLVTSREVLHLYGEYDYPVPVLSLPDPGARSDLSAIAHYDAVDLFVQRARAASPTFEFTEDNARYVAEICVRLDGLPLAIELAAARILVLEPEDLLARLSSRLKLLTGGPRNLPERQRTLRATIDWSYNLLEEHEQVLFRRLGVFTGGCTLKAIEEICGEPGVDTLNGVTSLIDKSLLQRQETRTTSGVNARRQRGELRFLMLETLREYAREKLEEAGELEAISDRHLDYFVGFAETAEEGLHGNEQARWLRRLDADQNNLRAALAWSLSRDDRVEKGLMLAGALVVYWDDRGQYSEGRQWCLQLLGRVQPDRPSVEQAKVLRALARMTWQLGDMNEPRSIYQESLEMTRAVGDEVGAASALYGLGSTVMWHGEYDLSLSFFEEGLATGRKLGVKYLIARALSMIGVIHMRKEEYRAAEAALDEALAIERELGNATRTAATLGQRASVAIHVGEYEKAKALVEESLGLARELDVDWIVTFGLARLGVIALLQSDPQSAEAYFLEGLARARESGIRRWSQWYLVGLAEIARLRGMVERAAKLIGASEGPAVMAGAHYEPATTAEIERITASVRAALDEETFARLWAEGRGMPPEEVLAFVGSTPAAGTAVPALADSAAVQQPYENDLTEREIEVLRLIAEGKSNQEIGQELTLSRRTVERHISNIYEKIGASGKVARATATAYALRRGLAM